MGIRIEQHSQGVVINVKVVPGASRDRIIGPLGDALKIAVSAPPEDGKANQAVLGLLAEALGIPSRSISIVQGHAQPRKRVMIVGLEPDQLTRLVNNLHA